MFCPMKFCSEAKASTEGINPSPRDIRLGVCRVKIPYSRKYWRKLNLAVEPQIAITRVLVDFNLAVQYRIAIHIYASRKFWQILIWRL